MELISKITENHHRSPNFIRRIEKIFLHFSELIKQSFTNQELFDIFKDNKRILLLLIQTKLVTFDDSIIQYILSISKFEKDDAITGFRKILAAFLQKKPNEKETYHHCYAIYFYPEITDQIDIETRNMICKEAEKIGINFQDNFEEKRENGLNENYICELIRSDLVEDFIVYVNKKNISLETIIYPSIFETNILLVMKPPTLIEYAAFYGSIQIVQYLKFNNAELKPDLWIYSIHSNNPELIHLLEENQVEPPNDSFKTCLKEAIKCHHNNIANYIIDNLIKENDEIFDIEQEFYENVTSYCFEYNNYFFYPENVDDKYLFLYLCQFNYLNLVKLFLKYKDIDINYMIVYK